MRLLIVCSSLARIYDAKRIWLAFGWVFLPGTVTTISFWQIQDRVKHRIQIHKPHNKTAATIHTNSSIHFTIAFRWIKWKRHSKKAKTKKRKSDGKFLQSKHSVFFSIRPFNRGFCVQFFIIGVAASVVAELAAWYYSNDTYVLGYELTNRLISRSHLRQSTNCDGDVAKETT